MLRRCTVRVLAARHRVAGLRRPSRRQGVDPYARASAARWSSACRSAGLIGTPSAAEAAGEPGGADHARCPKTPSSALRWSRAATTCRSARGRLTRSAHGVSFRRLPIGAEDGGRDRGDEPCRQAPMRSRRAISASASPPPPSRHSRLDDAQHQGTQAADCASSSGSPSFDEVVDPQADHVHARLQPLRTSCLAYRYGDKVTLDRKPLGRELHRPRAYHLPGQISDHEAQLGDVPRGPNTQAQSARRAST